MILARWLPRALIVGGVLAASPADAVPSGTYLQPIGGGGGTDFAGACKPGEMLTGFQLRIIDGGRGSAPGFENLTGVGGYLDALRPTCATASAVNHGAAPVLVGIWGRVQAGEEEYWRNAGFFGGAITVSNNAQMINRLCPADQPVVTGIKVTFGKNRGFTVVWNITPVCGIASTEQPVTVVRARTAQGLSQSADEAAFFGTDRSQGCPRGQVAIGAHGRAGALVDAVGLICGAPPSAPLALAMHNSVTSANTAARSVGIGADELAARGAVVASADPLAVELRARAPDDSVRRGFDIGMAAAEGNTAPGPGKQRIHDSLPAAEQGGFDTAVSFSLQRNKNAKFAATGAAIAQADPVVAQARQADSDVFYRLGFDIASGIFGDPVQGALGNTATGPGSARIRDALIPAAQRGFNASADLHLHRNTRVTAAVTPYGRANSAAHDRVYLDTNKPTAQVSAYEELRCRGGAGLQFTVIDGRTNSSGEATSYVTMTFNPAAQPADASGLSLLPGQCSFPTRVVGRHEPNDLFVEMLYFGQLKQQLHGTPVDNSPTAAQRYPDAQNLPRYLADPKHYWSFYVHQNAELPFGRFVTDENFGRYWIPGLSRESVVNPVESRRAR